MNYSAQGRSLICVMAKVPEAGAVKTRLCPPLSPTQAAALAEAFLGDTWSALSRFSEVDCAVSFAGDATKLPTCLAHAERWAQSCGDLGARMEHELLTGLERAPKVVLIGSDAPALPTPLLMRALDLLDHSDTVIGPAIDGGYYLLGARRFESSLLDELPWSTSDTRAATVQRLISRGYSVAELPTWFDVDDAAALDLLRRVIDLGIVDAPATSRVLAELSA